MKIDVIGRQYCCEHSSGARAHPPNRRRASPPGTRSQLSVRELRRAPQYRTDCATDSQSVAEVKAQHLRPGHEKHWQYVDAKSDTRSPDVTEGNAPASSAGGATRPTVVGSPVGGRCGDSVLMVSSPGGGAPGESLIGMIVLRSNPT
jgi:hypothetical protein